jgi:hypothetical protein
MTCFWSVLGEGSSDDSIVILSENKSPVNRRCFLPPCPPLTTCHPERIHPSHLQIFENVRWMSEGSPRPEQILESIIHNKNVNKEMFRWSGNLTDCISAYYILSLRVCL